MKEPSLEGMLGRYEYQDSSSDKFWHIIYDRDSGMYRACWGRTGRAPQGEKDYTGKEALKKVREKISKGYRLTLDDGTEVDVHLAKKRVEKKRSERKAAFDFMKELKEIK